MKRETELLDEALTMIRRTAGDGAARVDRATSRRTADRRRKSSTTRSNFPPARREDHFNARWVAS
jgi:hypothetical protein